jgi:hypothetical protein
MEGNSLICATHPRNHIEDDYSAVIAAGSFDSFVKHRIESKVEDFQYKLTTWLVRRYDGEFEYLGNASITWKCLEQAECRVARIHRYAGV